MGTVADSVVDVSGVCCPLPLIQLARAIRELQPGQTLLIKGNDPLFEPAVTDFCTSNRHEILSVTPGEQGSVSIHIKVGA
jgi:tRNA 2-thiouridine synthesizing protein A